MTKNNDTIFQKATLNTNRKNIKLQISIDLPKGTFKKKCLLLSNALDKPFFYPFFMTVSIINVITVVLCGFILNWFTFIMTLSLFILVITLYDISAYKDTIADRIRYYKTKVKTFYNNDGFSKRSLLDVDTTNFTKDEICQLVEYSPDLIKAYQKANGKTELLPKEWQWFNKKKYSLKNGLENIDKSNKCYDIIKNEYVIGKIVVNRENHYINHFEVLTISKNDLVLADERKNSLLDMYYTELAKLYSENNIKNKNESVIGLVINYFKKPKKISNNNQYHNNHRHLTYIRRENVSWQK